MQGSKKSKTKIKQTSAISGGSRNSQFGERSPIPKVWRLKRQLIIQSIFFPKTAVQKIGPRRRVHRCGSRIWSRGAPASESDSCRCSEAESYERSEQCVAGIQGQLKGPGSFWVFNAQICVLPHSRDSFSLIFDTYFNT